MSLKIVWVLIILFNLVSCGKGTNSTKYNPPSNPEYSPIFLESNSEFNIFINDFSHQYTLYKGSSFSDEIPPINFYDLDNLPFLSRLAINVSKHYNNNGSTMAGVCLSYPSGQREILIDPQIWEQIDLGNGCNGDCFERKMALIFHELGHCVLNRTHLDTKYQGYNLSIMNSLLIKQNDIVRWNNDYMEELFTEDHSNIQNSIHNYLEL